MKSLRLPAGATPSPLPDQLKPQLAILGELPTAAEDFIFELKYDGYRMLARVDKKVRLITRNGHDWTRKMPRMREALDSMQLPPGWYDGEAVMCDETGKPDFGLTQAAFASKSCDGILFVIFDAPYLAGHDLRAVALENRRALLQEVLAAEAHGQIRFSAELIGPPDELLRAACDMNLEGLICKRRGSQYVDGKRSTAWRKVKCGKRAALVIGGYVASRSGLLNKLLLGMPEPGGKLTYAGSVGTGFTEQLRRDLATALAMIRSDESPFVSGGVPQSGLWVNPWLVADTQFAEWTKAGRIRHPVFKGVSARPGLVSGSS